MSKEYQECAYNLWTGFVGKATCEAGYLKCDGLSCPLYTPKKEPKPQTHYDLLISKTLEEMAEWLDLNSFVMLKGPRCKGCFSGECDLKECRQCYLDWLKEPVDEEVE